MKKSLSIFALAALVFVGCVKDLDYDFEDTDPKVVVISCVEPGLPVNLRITYSRFFLSTAPFRTVDNAVVKLQVNGAETDAEVYYLNERYVVDYRPQPGDRLDLSVQVPGHGTVSASTVVPTPADVSNIRTSKQVNEDGDTTCILHFNLQDPADEDNYYFVRIRSYEELNGRRSSYFNYLPFYCSDPLIVENADVVDIIDGIEGGNPNEWKGRQLYFLDGNIAGRNHEMEISFKAAKNYSTDHNYAYQMEITTLTRDRYLYEVTTDLYSGDELEAIFSDPVQIHHNIDGGIGIFAARNTMLVDIPQHP